MPLVFRSTRLDAILAVEVSRKIPVLLRRIIEYARNRGITEIYGEVLSDNRPMLRLCQVFGFSAKRSLDDPGIVNVSLNLRGARS